jgi:hypothetical protein
MPTVSKAVYILQGSHDEGRASGLTTKPPKREDLFGVLILVALSMSYGYALSSSTPIGIHRRLGVLVVTTFGGRQ